MDTHSQLQVGVIQQRLTDFQCAFNRSFGRRGKDQRHTIASRQPSQFTVCLGRMELVSIADNVVKLLLELLLLVDEQLRVADDIDE